MHKDGVESAEALMDRIFKKPPDKPDTRMVFLGGVGIITIFRGLNNIYGRQPQADLFDIIGTFFVDFWGWMWVLIGLFVLGTAISGHRFPVLDLTAAYLVLCIWWMWALIYFLSAIFVNNERLPDFLSAMVLSITGLVLTAGIIMSIRKTQLLALNAVLKDKVVQLNHDLIALAAETEALRKEIDEP